MKELLKRLVMRLMRPGLVALDRRTEEIAHRAAEMSDRLDRIESSLGPQGATGQRLDALERQSARMTEVFESLAGATIAS